MKKITLSLRITMLLFLGTLVEQTTAVANTVIPKVFSSKKAFSEFCASVSEKTGIRADWVDALVQNIFHTKSTDLILKLFPTLTAEKVDQFRQLLITNQILDVTKNEPAIELKPEQFTDTANAILRYMTTNSKNRFATELGSQAVIIGQTTGYPVSKVQRICEKLVAYSESTVLSAEALSTTAKN